MQIEIDISLLTTASAIGRVSGLLELAWLPRIGETISLYRAASASAGFDGQLKVVNVTHYPNLPPVLSLSDIVAPNEDSAKDIGNALAQMYGLFFDPYD